MQTGTFQTHTDDGFYSLHYKIWGGENPKTLVCIAGLLGSSNDFKFIGETLANHGYRTVSFDLAGRGLSNHFNNPDDYCFKQYLKDINAFLTHINCDKPLACDWFGVSLGGLLGIRIAGMNNTPINRLILSDIGPEVPQFDLDFILKVINNPTIEYESVNDFIPILKMALNTPYSRGELGNDGWEYMAKCALKQNANGKYIRGYDPRIAKVFATHPLGETNLWDAWDKITAPVLAVRGELSTLFPTSIADEMQRRKTGGKMNLVTVPNCGHVPSFYRDDQIKIITDYLCL